MGVTWRSAWQGSTSGPITGLWRVRAYPTIYVLDEDGRIRYKNARGKALDAAVATLIGELKEKEKEEPR